MGADKQMSPSSRMTSGLEAFKRKDYAAALSEFVSCFDRGAHDEPAFGGVRRSFLLGYMRSLGNVYPPALAALQERRNDIGNLLHKCEASADEAVDFAALNRALEEEWVTGHSYHELRDHLPESVRKALFVEATSPLVAARIYGDVSERPIELVAFVRDRLDQSRRQLDVVGYGADAEAARYVKTAAIEEAAEIFEALIGAGKGREAEDAAAVILEFETSGDVFATLIRHALRADAIEAADELYRRGMSLLAPEQAGVLRSSVGTLLKKT